MYLKITKLCYFNQDNPVSFLSIPSVVSVGDSEKSWFNGDEMSVQTWRWTVLLQVLRVTISGSRNHVCSQA